MALESVMGFVPGLFFDLSLSVWQAVARSKMQMLLGKTALSCVVVVLLKKMFNYLHFLTYSPSAFYRQ